MTIVAIHQPNFFPWLGYFDKIRRADVFVFLDHVQFQKTGGTWCNRVKLLIAGEPRWVTAPIVRSFHGTKTVNEIEFKEETQWRDKLLRTLEAAYRRAPYFDEIMPLLNPLIQNAEHRIAEYNIAAIRALCDKLGFNVNNFERSSQLDVAGKSTGLLIGLTKAVEGSTYLCGGGAGGYQDDAAFGKAKLSLNYQTFTHPVYRQPAASSFFPGLSIIDALMCRGVEGTAEMLLNG